MRSVSYPFPVSLTTIHDQIDLAYMEHGQGTKTILFIHGLANYAPVWKYQLKALGEQHRCIAIDLPGNGFSSRGDYPYTLFFYAECVVKFIEKLNLNNVYLCGHSMGGQIALIIALRYPHLLKKLLLVAPAGFEFFAPHEVMMMQQMLNMGNMFYADEYHLETAIKQSFFKTHAASNEIITDLKKMMQAHAIKDWRNMSLSGIHAMLNEQVQPYLSTIRTPTHAIFGERDALIPNTLIHFGETPESIAKKACALIPDSGYSIIAQAGHFVQIEKADEVNAILFREMEI